MKTFSATALFLGLLALACIGWVLPVSADAVAAAGMEEAADSVAAGDDATRVRRGRINARMLQYSNGYYSGGHYSSSGSHSGSGSKGSKKGKKSKKSKKGKKGSKSKGSKSSSSYSYYH